jgi:hypothetical protein
MAAETSYIVAEYDNEAGGPFVAGDGTLVTWTGGSGQIVTLIDDGTTGKLAIALVSGDKPTNNEQLTQGGVTADTSGPAPTGDSEDMLYPAYFREDTSLAASGALSWGGPALGATHSFFFDGQTSNFVVGEILTFSGGQQCEVVTIVSDTGAAGEVDIRWISFLDTLQFPNDNDTFTGDIAGDGALNGVVHPRCYSPLHLHRLLADLNDDSKHAGNDVLSVYNPTPSARSTDQIVSLNGTVTITDTIAQHMFGGSVDQTGGATQYSGLDVQVTDSDNGTNPVIIQDDAIVSAYWENAYMPDSIAGKIRILRKTREDDVNIDGKRIKGKLLRFNDTFFEGATTLGQASTALALFSASDGNNQTAVGTVAGAPYNTIVLTEGYQLIDYNNGNGAQPYALELEFGSASSIQAYERTKYVQREGTAETINGRNAQLFTGVTLDFAYDGESGGPFSEDEIVAWGTEVPYTGEAGGPFTVGNVIEDDVTFARGRILYLDDQGLAGTLIVAQDSGSAAFGNTNAFTEYSGGTATGATGTTGTVVTNSAAGTMVLLALDDNGTDGFFYGQRTRGVEPADNQAVYGATSLATALVDVATSLNTRVVNTQFIGNYTGSAFNPANFGMAVDTTDATASDLFTDLLGATQQPPNNQQGVVTSGEAGDYVTVYPWDGAATDVNGNPEPTFAEATLDVALTAGVSTTIDVNAIPINTPTAGFLRVERNSDNEYDLVEYVSFAGSVYTLGGSTPTAPSAASIGNNVFRALIDRVWALTGTDETYTAVQTGTNQVAVSLLRGGIAPIKPFKGSATFGATGFVSAAQRISDA